MSAITAFINNEDLGRLKAELQILRRKGALKTSADYDSTCPDPERSCGRCRIELGRVINRGAYCRACRLKVCKGCREYSFKTTDWVCTVCHKHMEIQAASGEWMNEFVRRPSRRRDNRVYVPAADIIKRTIRRSWTISNPSSRWNAVRGSPETRPYNSLPRGQDITNYPALAVHQVNAKNAEPSRSPSPSKPKHSPAKRSHSEDVYNEREAAEAPKSPRVNPLIKYAASEKKKTQNDSESDNSDKENDLLKKNKRTKVQHAKSDTTAEGGKPGKQCLEVSMSVDTGRDSLFEKRVSFSNDEDDGGKGKPDADGAESPDVPIELCDIEPISGTVFRKVTVRRRRQEMRKMPATDAGARVDVVLPEGDDYKLVFISSDSSSKEEDPDDNDSSSASSFPIDECDWDYFEPGGKVNFSEVVECVHQKEVRERCERCGGGGNTQYIPVPVPIPVPVHSWSPVLGSMEVLRAQLRVLPRVLWPYLNQAAVMWAGEDERLKDLGVESEGLPSSSDDEKTETRRTAASTEKGIRKSKSFSVNTDAGAASDGVRKSRSYCDKHKTEEKRKRERSEHENEVEKMFTYFIEEVRKNTDAAARKRNYFETADRIYTTSECSSSNDDSATKIRNVSESDERNYESDGTHDFKLITNKRGNQTNKSNESNVHGNETNKSATRKNKSCDHNATRRTITADSNTDSEVQASDNDELTPTKSHKFINTTNKPQDERDFTRSKQETKAKNINKSQLQDNKNSPLDDADFSGNSQVIESKKTIDKLDRTKAEKRLAFGKQENDTIDDIQSNTNKSPDFDANAEEPDLKSSIDNVNLQDVVDLSDHKQEIDTKYTQFNENVSLDDLDFCCKSKSENNKHGISKAECSEVESAQAKFKSDDSNISSSEDQTIASNESNIEGIKDHKFESNEANMEGSKDQKFESNMKGKYFASNESNIEGSKDEYFASNDTNLEGKKYYNIESNMEGSKVLYYASNETNLEGSNDHTIASNEPDKLESNTERSKVDKIDSDESNAEYRKAHEIKSVESNSNIGTNTNFIRHNEEAKIDVNPMSTNEMHSSDEIKKENDEVAGENIPNIDIKERCGQETNANKNANGLNEDCEFADLKTSFRNANKSGNETMEGNLADLNVEWINADKTHAEIDEMKEGNEKCFVSADLNAECTNANRNQYETNASSEMCLESTDFNVTLTNATESSEERLEFGDLNTKLTDVNKKVDESSEKGSEFTDFDTKSTGVNKNAYEMNQSDEFVDLMTTIGNASKTGNQVNESVDLTTTFRNIHETENRSNEKTVEFTDLSAKRTNANKKTDETNPSNENISEIASLRTTHENANATNEEAESCSAFPDLKATLTNPNENANEINQSTNTNERVYKTNKSVEFTDYGNTALANADGIKRNAEISCQLSDCNATRTNANKRDETSGEFTDSNSEISAELVDSNATLGNTDERNEMGDLNAGSNEFSDSDDMHEIDEGNVSKTGDETTLEMLEASDLFLEDFHDGSVSCESGDNMSTSDDSEFEFEHCRSYIVNGSDDDGGGVVVARNVVSYTIDESEEENSDSSASSDSDDGEGGGRRYSRVYVVNEEEDECGVVLKGVKEYMSSPGLSDVSAESLSSSDVEVGCDKRAAVGERNESVGIRSGGAVIGEGAAAAGVAGTVAGEQETSVSRSQHQDAAAARYTSLVMITQEAAPAYAPVSVVTTDTTTLVADGDVVVRHTNWHQDAQDKKARNSYYSDKQSEVDESESVTVITGADTLSAVVCLEEGLADDDSWVETISHDDEDDFCASTNDDSSSGEEVTLHCTAAIDHEDELRGYHRSAIDFTLHTIVEESCEESEVETTSRKKPRPTSVTDLEKYFYFNLGEGNANPREDQFSETSSICSESMDSFPGGGDDVTNSESADPAELASSRLEKYFLTGFTSFKERRDSDGSVGSDSEGRPSPEQRRKRLVRARGTGRSHSSSLDNLISNPELSASEQPENSEDSSSSDTDTYDDSNNFEKIDGQFDTVKRKKCKKQKPNSPSEELKELNEDAQSEEDGHKTPQPVNAPENIRDSGFIGSNDDLNKDPEPVKPETQKTNLYNIQEEKKESVIVNSTPPATLLTRKDSFNNWSSDEETNLMMSKMRQFFKTMVNVNAPKNQSVVLAGKPVPSPRLKNRQKPPQLVYFENELTRLMKTVPGIRDDQVREIVEYLSSEDTWSDSYDSSDYTSSDLENTTVAKSALQQQISDSCKQIINKFDGNAVEDEEGDEGDGGIVDETHGLNRETAFVYQKLIASFDKMATGEEKSTPHNSPPLIAKVMHHIGSRLVALMHEVSSGESHASNSPKNRHYHKRLQQKLSNASTTTTEDDDSISECNLENLGFNNNNNSLLPRSRSHDLLLSEKSNTGTHDTNEEREVSDCERFSWRGSFESALLATDSRNKLSEATSSSALALAAKRRSAGDLLFTHKSLSREQLDRVRSCGSIGGANPEEKIWARPSRRRSSVPDASCGSGGSADDEDDLEQRSTLPRSLQTGTATTNSLPRLPTNAPASNIQKAQSMYHFLQQGVKSARYRPPGFNRLMMSAPKRALSAPGLQPTPQRRGRRQQAVVPSDDVSLSEAHSSPMLASRTSKSASPSPVAHKSKRAFGGSQEWHHTNEDDIDRLVSIHHTRSSLSNLGVQSHFTRVSRSDSMASVYSGAGEGRYGTVAVKGQVEFGLQYNYKTAALEINIKQCRELAAVDAKRSRSDPYVKVYLLPDKSKSGKRKTKVKKHTLNPVFDECLKFHISLNGLETRTLWLTVWHSDMFGRNDFLGEVMMTLENKVFDDPTPKWYNLQERTEPFDDMLSFKGDILVGLKFVPPDMTVHKKGKRSRGALHVLVKEAKSLTAVKANGTSDPFCKSYLLPDKGRSGKQKTGVVRRTTNPVWNHTFVYDDVTLQELAERCLELTVWDHDRLASNEFLGGVRFSLGTGKHYGKLVDWMDATGKEMTLWKSMLERPNFWVEGCLSLRPTLDHRTTS